MRIISFEDLPSALPRIEPIDVNRLHIEGYDVDNGYPQRMLTMIDASPTATLAVGTFADFVFGQGLDEDGAVWDMVLNSKGQTGDELFELICNDYAKFKNFILHFNYNALFDGVEVNHIPYQNRRNGIGEKAGHYAICSKWWNNSRFGKGLGISKDKIDYIPVFNPDPLQIKKEVRDAGGWNSYKGQVYVFNPEYTLCTIDACLDAVEAEILAGQTSKNNLKNNFGDKVIWQQPEQDRATIAAGVNQGKESAIDPLDAITSDLQSWVGPNGAQLIVAEFKSEADKIDLKFIENKLDDKKFKFTTENSRATIYRQYGQPAILHADLSEGRYNQNQLPESFKYYNNKTEKDRIKMQRALSRTLGVVIPELKNEDFAITPLNDMGSATENTEGANANPTNNADNQE